MFIHADILNKYDTHRSKSMYRCVLLRHICKQKHFRSLFAMKNIMYFPSVSEVVEKSTIPGGKFVNHCFLSGHGLYMFLWRTEWSGRHISGQVSWLTAKSQLLVLTYFWRCWLSRVQHFDLEPGYHGYLIRWREYGVDMT